MSQGQARSRAGTFSGMDAAFEGFRITREHPFAVGVWALLFFATSLVSNVVLEAMAGDAMRSLQGIETGAGANMAEVGALLGAVAPAMGVLALIALPVSALVTNAVMRTALSERGDALAFLRLGGRELWQTLNLLLWTLVLFVTYIAAVIVSLIPTFLVSMLLGMVVGPVGATLGAIVAIVLVGLIMLLVGGRLSLAGPITTVEGGIGLGRSWTATKGLTWALAGSLFIAWVFSLIVTVLVGVVAVAVMAAMMGGLSEAWAYISSGSIEGGTFSPIELVYLAFSAVLNTLSTVIVLGVGVGGYRQLRGASPGQG